MSTIIIFAISLFIASTLITIKAFELKFQKKNIILRLASKFDEKSSGVISKIKFRSFQIVQSIRYIALVQIKELSKKIFEGTKEVLAKEYRARQDVIMGKIEIGNKGSASFYLKKIAENKENSEKGKIE